MLLTPQCCCLVAAFARNATGFFTVLFNNTCLSQRVTSISPPQRLLALTCAVSSVGGCWGRVIGFVGLRPVQCLLWFLY